MIRRFFARRRYMREHRWTHAHLSSYLDADLAPDEAVRVEDHVGICPQCKRVLATLRQTMEGLRALHAEPPSSGIADGVVARLRQEP